MGLSACVCDDDGRKKRQYTYFLLLWNNEAGFCFPFTYFCKSKYKTLFSITFEKNDVLFQIYVYEKRYFDHR